MVAFADALERGELQLSSPYGAIQARLDIPHPRLRLYRDALLSTSDVEALVLALRVTSEAVARVESKRPLIEVAWTYPRAGRPGLRTTGGVARELIDGSRTTLLVVGYAVTVDPALTGLAAQTVAAIANAARRGVTVTAVLHRDVNREALLHAWKSAGPLPALFTWPLSGDEMAAVHAKLLVADRQDALITSANLTYHGLERNLEMGVRVTGRAACEIDDKIRELIAAQELVPWDS